MQRTVEVTAMEPILSTAVEALSAGQEGKKAMESRFGPVIVDISHAIYFASGLLGIPGELYFCLADFPGKEHTHFKVLQCLNDPSLAFAVLPLPRENALIQIEDIQECCGVLEVAAENLGILLIASSHVTPEGKKISVNVRAPIIIDTEKRAAVQYVFSNNAYQIRHML